MLPEQMIYDWNSPEAALLVPDGGEPQNLKERQSVEFLDDTLRDGLQSPSISYPSIQEKLKLLHLADEIGIHTMNIGMPSAGPRVKKDVIRLAEEIRDKNLKITARCLARTLNIDIAPIVAAAEKVGIPIEVGCFLGSSPIRQYVEEWNLDRLVRFVKESISIAVGEGLPTSFTTEDASRSHPMALRLLYTTAIDVGAYRIVVTDTVGHLTPEGTRNLIKYARHIVKETGKKIAIDFHGHNDRGLALANGMAAVEAGADRVHACAIGLGERTGNTPMELLLVNLQLLGKINLNLHKLEEYCRLASKATKIPIPVNYPVMGSDAFRTGTGVHAAAVIKAKKKGDAWLADRIYSGVPAEMVGRKQIVDITPMSGESNIIFWLEEHSIPPDPDLVEKIFDKAKRATRALTEEEILALVRSLTRARGGDIIFLGNSAGREATTHRENTKQ